MQNDGGFDVRPALPVWDPGQLTELVGDLPDAKKRLMESFLRNARKQVRELELVLAGSGGLARLGFLGHKLKSSARAVGAMALGELAQQLETTSDSDVPASLALAEKIVLEFSKVEQRMLAT